MADLRNWSELASDVVLRLVGAFDDELDDVVTETLAVMATRCRAERAYVTFYDVDHDTFDISHEWTAGVVPHRPTLQAVELSRFPYSVGCARRGEVLVAHDLDDLPPEGDPERASFGAFGVRAVLQVPIVINGATVGIAGLNRFAPGDRWEPEVVEFAERAGQAVGVALVRQRAARDVATARAHAQAAQRSRDELLAHVSHELRTPLHAILGYAELLELDERSDHDRDALMRIQTNGRRLLAMIDDLTALARSAGVATGPLDVASVVGDVLADLHAVAAEHGLELSGGASGEAIGVEPGRLRQIVRCLVIGAAQAMRGGRITIDATGDHDDGVRLAMTLTSPSAIPVDALVLPMTDALVAGRGSVQVDGDPTDAANARVDVRLVAPGQTDASP